MCVLYIYTLDNPISLSKWNALGELQARHTGMVVVSQRIVFMTTAKVQIDIDAWLPGSCIAAIDQVAIQGVTNLHAVGVIVAIGIRAVHARRTLRCRPSVGEWIKAMPQRHLQDRSAFSRKQLTKTLFPLAFPQKTHSNPHLIFEYGLNSRGYIMLHHQLRIIIDHIWCDDATILIVLINHIIIIALWLFNIAMENGPLK